MSTNGRKIGSGALRASGRQGIKELGEALKPFRDSISVDEPGTMWSPTQGEIADKNRETSIDDRIRAGAEKADAKDKEAVKEKEPERDPLEME